MYGVVKNVRLKKDQDADMFESAKILTEALSGWRF